MRVSELRKAARGIFDAAVRAVDPAEAIRRHLVRDGERLVIAGERVDLGAVREIVVVGLGKAGAPMAAAVEDRGARITRGSPPSTVVQPTGGSIDGCAPRA
jgi:hydroxypyruvate reductase